MSRAISEPTRRAQDSQIDSTRTDADAVDVFLRSALGARRASGSSPARLVDAMEYSLFAGGKRLRPVLTLAAYRACSTSNSSRHAAGLPAAGLLAATVAAGAMELIHTFSLVHDDLPAMDDDDFRRGRATNHKVFGEAMAVLAGDAMVTLAFELLATETQPSLAAILTRELAVASGPAGMIGGQVLDIDSEHQALSFEQLASLHAMKTGALLTCSCRMGAICAGADESKLDALTRFGRHLGLAFQIVDDLLDVTATTEQLGKQSNKDAAAGKNTYPQLIGIDRAREEADRQLSAALSALDTFEQCDVEPLRAIATYVVHRTH